MGELPTLKIYPPGSFVEVDGDALFLGRDCHLAALIPCLLNKVVSNRHCAIRRDGTRWMLEDLGSTNGTWIHGQRLAGKILLHTGDEFTLGSKGPLVECVSGFGGTGPDRTIPEDELPKQAKDAAATLADDPRAAKTALIHEDLEKTAAPAAKAAPGKAADARSAAATAGAGGLKAGAPDGSAVHPFRVGKTPCIRLVHKKTGETYRASGYTIVIGRDPGAAQIVIRTEAEKHVSGRHAEIQFRSDGTVVLRDLGSRNGTWLNDRPLKGDAPLKAGDLILLGNAPTVLLVAALETA